MLPARRRSRSSSPATPAPLHPEAALAALEADGVVAAGEAAVYASLHAAGLHYGPAYRSLSRVYPWAGDAPPSPAGPP